MEHRVWFVSAAMLLGALVACEKSDGRLQPASAGAPEAGAPEASASAPEAGAPAASASAPQHRRYRSKVLLGKALFFDDYLSEPPGQACAVCHGPEVGWTGPIEELNAHGAVYEGAVPGRFGNRKPPSSAYATPSPILHWVEEEGDALFIGGNFWNGRATGEKLGSPAADQAQGPFLNPLEQNNPTPQSVCRKVRESRFPEEEFGQSYAELFRKAFGPGSLDCEDDPDGTYDRIAWAIAIYEGSDEVNQYSSKFDHYLSGCVELSEEEAWGLALFEGKGQCANCHPSRPGPDGEPPLFTDFTYDNLGVPRNPENPFYRMPLAFNPFGRDWVDAGLGEFLSTRPDYVRFYPENVGKQKVPTLRNVDKRPQEGFVKAYGHNGYFKSLERIVHFYNTRDVLPVCPESLAPITDEVAREHGCWPPAEIPVNVNVDELGNLGLTPEEERAIVAFMKTLSDGYERDE